MLRGKKGKHRGKEDCREGDGVRVQEDRKSEDKGEEEREERGDDVIE